MEIYITNKNDANEEISIKTTISGETFNFLHMISGDFRTLNFEF